MAYENSNAAFTGRAASAIQQHQPVMLLGALTPASALDEAVIPASQAAGPYFGVARASAAAGEPVTVDIEGIVKCKAAASIGAGAFVAVGSTNGGLVVATAAGAASVIKYQLGIALANAAAGDIFPVHLKQEQLV